MSSGTQPVPPATVSATTKKLSATFASTDKQLSDHAQDEHPIDVKLDRLKKDILPPAPYLLRLRNRSAQYHARDRYYWRKDTLFNEDEEELQYLTFRQTHEGTILYAQGQWDDGNGGIAPKEMPSSQTSSGHTPLQIAKKKITLADYKKLDKSKPRTPDMNGTSSEGPVGQGAQDISEMPKEEAEKVEDEIQHRAQGNLSLNTTQSTGPAGDPTRKRSASAMIGINDVAGVEQGPSTLPSKKGRSNTELLKDDLNKDLQERESEAQAALSSPTAAAELRENRASDSKEEKLSVLEKHNAVSVVTASLSEAKAASLHGLPPMLSPTLPPEIEEELAKLTPTIRGGGLSSSRLSSISPSMHGKDHSHTLSASSQLKLSSTNLHPSIPSNPKQRRRDPKEITSAPRQQHEDQSSRSTIESVILKKSKIVKLKIRNKGNRRTLMQYLRMKPTPNRGSQKVIPKSLSAESTSERANKFPAHGKPLRSSSPTNADESSDTDEPLAKRNSGKRRASELDNDEYGTNTVKRRRRSGQLQQQQELVSKSFHSSRKGSNSLHEKASVKAVVSTPTQPLVNSAHKSHLNILSSSMQRTGSQESAATPARDITPTANGHKTESPERREWRKEVKFEISRLVKLATDIKHDSDAFLKHLKGQDYEKHRELGTVIATEATLCFMLAAIVSDEPGRSSNNPSNTDLWKSTRDFIASLSSNHAKKFQYLFGFLKQLEAIVCDTLTYQHDMRGDAILKEYNRLKGQEAVALTPSADSYIAENWNFLKEAQETRFQARTAWREGQHALFDPDLERQFPKTWSRRRAFPGRGKGRDPVFLNQYGREGFALPLGINSTALDAVNFGLSFLAELCEKDGVKWEPKLKL